jgi:hypothetical protein
MYFSVGPTFTVGRQMYFSVGPTFMVGRQMYFSVGPTFTVGRQMYFSTRIPELRLVGRHIFDVRGPSYHESVDRGSDQIDDQFVARPGYESEDQID